MPEQTLAISVAPSPPPDTPTAIPTQRLVQPDHRQRHPGRTFHPLLLRRQQRALHGEDVDEIDHAFDVLLLCGAQGDLVLAYGFGEAVAAALAGVVCAQLVVDFMPGAQHGLLVGDGRFLLLGFAQLQHAAQASAVEQRQAELRADTERA